MVLKLAVEQLCEESRQLLVVLWVQGQSIGQRSKVVRADGVKLKLNEAFKFSVLSKYLLLV